MPDWDQLDTLTELFPACPRSELAERLLCASSLETLINELLAEQSSRKQTARNGYDENVQQLKELFPAEDINALAAALQEKHGDMSATIQMFVCDDLPVRLAQVTSQPVTVARQALLNNENSFLNALTEILTSHSRKRRAWVSRVQDRPSSQWQQAFVLEDSSPTVAELCEYVWSEPSLQKINYDFLLKSLAFFDGNVARVLEVARLYIDANQYAVTYDHRFGLVDKKAPLAVTTASILGAPAQNIAPKIELPAASIKDKHLMSEVHASRDQSKLVGSSSLPHARNGRLDLHGFTVSEAQRAVKDAADSWWSEETDERLRDGRMSRFGSRAVFFAPLEIITGRGIHSSNGPKLPKAVTRTLSQCGYLWDEHVGRICIVGKKK